MPALSTLEGATLELVRETHEQRRGPGARAVPPRPRAQLLAAPNEQLTTLEGSKLWQLALLELWLARMASEPPRAAVPFDEDRTPRRASAPATSELSRAGRRRPGAR